MHETRFDALAKSFSSRRSALKGGAAGLGVAVLSGLRGRTGAAQEATPTATAGVVEEPTFLFVQTAASGTFVPNPGAGTPETDGTPTPGGGADYLLTLEGHPGGTVYFSDRPERVFGEAPTDQFLDGLGFAADNPPNAALVAQTDMGEEVVVLELVEPVYDADAGTITYGANVLSEYGGEGLAHLGGRAADDFLAESFTRASLFIDDCADEVIMCNGPGGQVGSLGSFGFCWHFGDTCCQPCQARDWPKLCNQTFPACNGNCTPARYGCW